MSDIKLWENPLFSIEERWVHANAEIFARGQTIAALKEQNAMLTVRVQQLVSIIERIDSHTDSTNDGVTHDLCQEALTAHPQQVKSELGHVGVFTREINSGFGAFKYEVYQGEPLEPGTKLYTHGDETRKKAARYDWLKSHARTIEWFEADESREREYLRPTLDDDIDAAISAQD